MLEQVLEAIARGTEEAPCASVDRVPRPAEVAVRDVRVARREGERELEQIVALLALDERVADEGDRVAVLQLMAVGVAQEARAFFSGSV